MAEDVVIVGAGPYGLSVAAYLRAAGIRPRVFGRTMGYWRESMPEGMQLRSAWSAASIGSPGGRLSIDRFERETGRRLERPVDLREFLDYGEWFARHAAPDADPRRVTAVRGAPGGFALTLEDGEELAAYRVVMATGLEGNAHVPPEFARLRGELVRHASQLRRPADLAGRRVAVIGGGQSAIETGALLHETGAEVEILVRASTIHWLARAAAIRRWTGPLKRLLYAPNDVGPPGVSWIVAKPGLYRRFPTRWRRRMCERCIRPAASHWLIPRTRDVPITLGRAVVAAAPARRGGVELRLNDGTARTVDTIVLGTGYRFDVRAHPLLDSDLVEMLERVDGAPALDSGFQSSVPGLYFTGALATPSFGPTMRFVSGTWATGPAAARHILDALRRDARRSAAPAAAY